MLEIDTGMANQCLSHSSHTPAVRSLVQQMVLPSDGLSADHRKCRSELDTALAAKVCMLLPHRQQIAQQIGPHSFPSQGHHNTLALMAPMLALLLAIL